VYPFWETCIWCLPTALIRIYHSSGGMPISYRSEKCSSVSYHVELRALFMTTSILNRKFFVVVVEICARIRLVQTYVLIGCLFVGWWRRPFRMHFVCAPSAPPSYLHAVYRVIALIDSCAL
jgi:hypothetical protein